jgi:hypothetical protein
MPKVTGVDGIVGIKIGLENDPAAFRLPGRYSARQEIV